MTSLMGMAKPMPSMEALELSLTFDEETNATQSQTQQDPAPQQTSSGGQGGSYGGNNYFNPWDYFFGW